MYILISKKKHVPSWVLWTQRAHIPSQKGTLESMIFPSPFWWIQNVIVPGGKPKKHRQKNVCKKNMGFFSLNSTPNVSLAFRQCFLYHLFNPRGSQSCRSGNDQPERTHETYKEGGGASEASLALRGSKFFYLWNGVSMLHGPCCFLEFSV